MDGNITVLGFAIIMGNVCDKITTVITFFLLLLVLQKCKVSHENYIYDVFKLV